MIASRAPLPVPLAPSFDLSGRTALVTASARGIGRAIAIALAQAGADVALGVRDLGTSDGLVGEIEALGRRAIPLAMDVTDLHQIQSAVESAQALLGRIDILVNNAGIAPQNPAEAVAETEFDRTLQANLKGTFSTTHC